MAMSKPGMSPAPWSIRQGHEEHGFLGLSVQLFIGLHGGLGDDRSLRLMAVALLPPPWSS
jgi:hypothetical protein